jgi:hypothetical protein
MKARIVLARGGEGVDHEVDAGELADVKDGEGGPAMGVDVQDFGGRRMDGREVARAVSLSLHGPRLVVVGVR